MTVAPEHHARWRGSALGDVTDRIELALVLTLAGPLTGKRVLDVACGDGVLPVAATMRGAKVTGVDTTRLTVQRQGRRTPGRLRRSFADG